MFNFFRKKEDENSENNSLKTVEENTEKEGFKLDFNFFKKAVSQTAQTLVENVTDVIKNSDETDDFVLDDMEDMLIKADLGVDVAAFVVDKLRNKSNLNANSVRDFFTNAYAILFF